MSVCERERECVYVRLKAFSFFIFWCDAKLLEIGGGARCVSVSVN